MGFWCIFYDFSMDFDWSPTKNCRKTQNSDFLRYVEKLNTVTANARLKKVAAKSANLAGLAVIAASISATYDKTAAQDWRALSGGA